MSPLLPGLEKLGSARRADTASAVHKASNSTELGSYLDEVVDTSAEVADTCDDDTVGIAGAAETIVHLCEPLFLLFFLLRFAHRFSFFLDTISCRDRH